MVRGLARRGGPRRGGGSPRASLRSPWADRRERANGIRGPARRGGPRRGGGSPEPRPRPTGANEPTDLPGWLARQGEVRSQPTKVPRSPQAEGKLVPGSRTCPIGENTFWGTTLAGAKTFPLTLATKNSKPAEPRPRTCRFFQTGPGSRTLDGPGHGALSLPGRRRAGWQVEASLDGGPRDPGRQAPRTPGGSGCVPLPWGPTTRPPSGRSGAK